jgi:hypothetical protein
LGRHLVVASAFRTTAQAARALGAFPVRRMLRHLLELLHLIAGRPEQSCANARRVEQSLDGLVSDGSLQGLYRVWR